MRQFFIISIIFLLVPLAFFAPYTGLISYVWIAYVRPHEWAYMPSTQLSLAVAVATLLGYVIFELTRRSPQLMRNGLLLLLWLQLLLATLFAQSQATAQAKLIEFSKTFLIALLMTAMVDTERRVRWLLIGTVFSIGFLAFRSNVGIVLTMGQSRIYGPGGAFEDNNDYALLLNVAAPITFCVAQGEKNRWLKRICYVLSAMMMITVIFTLSRGGFLGLCVIASGLAMKSKHKVIGVALVVILASLTFVMLPEQVIERVSTIQSARHSDESAQLRIQSWKVSLQIISDYPVFGIGPRNILQMYDRYLDTTAIRVAHNSFLQMAVDAGLPGLMLFLALLGLSYWRLVKSRRILKIRAPDSPLIAYCNGMEVALIGYIVSANFLSRHDLELVYQIVALATSIRLFAREQEREAEARELTGKAPRVFEPELVTH